MKWLMILLCVLSFGIGGCGTEKLFDSHIKMMDVMQGAVAYTSQSLQGGHPVQYMASGQVVEPGIVVELAQIWQAKAYYEGVGGQISAAGAGVSRDLTPEQWAMVSTIYQDKSLSDADRREKIMILLDKWLISKQDEDPPSE